MTSLFAVVAAWFAEQRRRLAIIGIAGRVISCVALALAATSVETHGWGYLFGAAVAIELAGWVVVLRGGGLSIVTGGATAALLAGAVVREAPRIALLEPPRPAAIEASGFPVFAITFVVGVIVIGWIVKTIRA
jgi:hypothetical protein